MPIRVQVIRSSVKGQRPTVGTREPGELYVSFADLQLGVVNAAKTAQDLIAIRFFAATTDYVTGNFVVQAGVVYRAKGPITAGAFNASQWDALSTATDLSGKENVIVAGTTADYWRGDKSWVPLTKGAVGLGNVDNTSDAGKPVSSATQTALNLKVDKAGDTMTGHLVLPTGPGNTNAVRKDYVDSADTTLQTNINLKANIASPAFTGNPTSVTPTAGDNDTSIATTAFVTSAVTTGTSGKIGEAPIDGIQYVRQNAAWSPVSVPPGTAVSDAPPGSPAAGQLWFESDSGRLFIYYTDANSSQWVQLNGPSLGGGTAETRNRVVNPAMQISQESGNSLLSGPSVYIADQWYMQYSLSTGTLTSQRVQVATPNGSRDRLQYKVTAADTSLAAGEYLLVDHRIEGIRVADFRYGSASARQVILRFGWKSPAGTYSIMLGNGALNRSYVANFTIAAGQANTDTVQTLVIPGDTTGTWPTDTGVGMWLEFALAAGSTFRGVSGWQAGEKYATASNTNGVATAGAVYELFDVGLYLDTYNTGIAPVWQMPDEAQELVACQRYYVNSGEYNIVQITYAAGGQYLTGMVPYPAIMRITPSITLIDGGTSNLGAVSTVNYVTNVSFGITIMLLATGAGYQVSTWICNARM